MLTGVTVWPSLLKHFGEEIAFDMSCRCRQRAVVYDDMISADRLHGHFSEVKLRVVVDELVGGWH